MAKTHKATIYIIGGTKGGTGKSTLSINFAAWFALQSRKVLLVDTDPQGSTSVWCELRARHGVMPPIPLAKLDGHDIGKHILAISQGFEDVVIDVGGYNSVELHAALEVSDVILIPARAGYFDFHSLTDLDPAIGKIRRTKNRRLRSLLVFNDMSPNPRAKDEPKLRASVAQLQELHALEPFIRHRGVFYESIPFGLGVHEHRPRNRKAIGELDAVFQEVIAHG